MKVEFVRNLIETGVVQDDTLVWTKGMVDWVSPEREAWADAEAYPDRRRDREASMQRYRETAERQRQRDIKTVTERAIKRTIVKKQLELQTSV